MDLLHPFCHPSSLPTPPTETSPEEVPARTPKRFTEEAGFAMTTGASSTPAPVLTTPEPDAPADAASRGDSARSFVRKGSAGNGSFKTSRFGRQANDEAASSDSEEQPEVRPRSRARSNSRSNGAILEGSEEGADTDEQTTMSVIPSRASRRPAPRSSDSLEVVPMPQPGGEYTYEPRAKAAAFEGAPPGGDGLARKGTATGNAMLRRMSTNNSSRSLGFDDDDGGSVAESSGEKGGQRRNYV
jgi:hypothetical protein